MTEEAPTSGPIDTMLAKVYERGAHADPTWSGLIWPWAACWPGVGQFRFGFP